MLLRRRPRKRGLPPHWTQRPQWRETWGRQAFPHAKMERTRLDFCLVVETEYLEYDRVSLMSNHPIAASLVKRIFSRQCLASLMPCWSNSAMGVAESRHF